MKAFSVGLLGLLLAGFTVGCGEAEPEAPTQEEIEQNKAQMDEDMKNMQLPQNPGAPAN